MDYRVRSQIHGLTLADEQRWEPFIETLERDAQDLGPVLSWDDDETASITLLIDSGSPVEAAQTATMVLAMIMFRQFLSSLFPSVVEIEQAEAEAEAGQYALA